MTGTSAVAGLANVSPERTGRNEHPVSVREAAAQFEALLIAQMLKAAREGSSAGCSGEEEDDASASALAMAEEHLAQVLAAGGGLGLARLVITGLTNESGGPNAGTAKPPSQHPSR